MPVKLVVALTDPDWFQFLRGKPGLDEVNFWAPSPRAFRALTPGEFFLFRLHAPYRTMWAVAFLLGQRLCLVGLPGMLFKKQTVLEAWLKCEHGSPGTVPAHQMTEQTFSLAVVS